MNRHFIGLLFILILLSAGCGSSELGYQPEMPIQSDIQENHFVGANQCKDCHHKQFQDWKGSHHEQAMKVADSTSIAGDFNNVRYESNGVKYSFFKREGKYYVNTQDGEGQYHDFEIVHTFGIAPLQQYLVAFSDGSYQCLQVAWDIEKGIWFDLQPDLKITTEEWLHWTRGAMRWNTMCADCHSSDLRKNYDPKTDAYQTTYSEINVACEACHGPGEVHVAHYKEGKNGVPPSFYMTSDMPSAELVDKCARCHSRRGQLTSHFDFQGEFLDHYDPSLIVEGVYEKDGQINDEDYVWGSFVQSKMYHNNVSCKDCHNVHSLKLKNEGNQLCLQCHETNYDSPRHHFHEENSEAGQCINCHMTGKTYMGNDFRRDHSFRVPRPDQSVTYGTPNACNGCHQDKSPKWASDFIQTKYGDERPEHFSDKLLAGYHGDKQKLFELIECQSFPDIARATALSYAAAHIDRSDVGRVKRLLRDTSVLVRNQAAILISQIDGQGQMIPEMTPLLADTTRLVRISAAKYFNRLSPSHEASQLFARAMDENLAAMKIQSDFPGGQFAMAIYYEENGSIQEAVRAYRRTLEIDNFYNHARMNLALLLYKHGSIQEAIDLYLKVIEQEPEYGQSYYMLGLLYHGSGDVAAALTYLKTACSKLPANDRAFYNYALLLQQKGEYQQSIQVLREGNALFPRHEEMIYVQLIGEMKLGDTVAAKSTVEQLLMLAPQNQTYLQIQQQIHDSN